MWAEHVLENLLRGAGVGGVAGDVIGKARRDEQRCPRRIGIRGRVAVSIGGANGGDRAPLAVGELRVPCGDERIGAGQVEKRERPRVLRQGQSLRDGHLAGDGIPVLRGGRDPDAGEVGL